MNNTVSWSLSIKTFFKITQQISFVIIDYPSLAEIMIIKNPSKYWENFKSCI